jgi:hypothetical protein
VMPKPSSSGSPRNSMPFARSSPIVVSMSSHISAISCFVEPSEGCTPSSAGGSLKMSQPGADSECSTDGHPSPSRSTARSASASGV